MWQNENIMHNKDHGWYQREDIVSKVKIQPFSLATDGSNDGNGEQLYPVLFSYFDNGLGR